MAHPPLKSKLPTVVARPNRKMRGGAPLWQHPGVEWGAPPSALALNGHVGRAAVDKAVWPSGKSGAMGAMFGGSLEKAVTWMHEKMKGSAKEEATDVMKAEGDAEMADAPEEPKVEEAAPAAADAKAEE